MTENNISCNLSTPQRRQRRTDIRNNFIPHLTDISRSESATKLTFAKPQVTLAQLDELIAAEGECCAFLQFEVSEHESHFQLSVTGPAGSEALINEFFADTDEDASETENTLSGSGCGCAREPMQQASPGQGRKLKSYLGGFVSLCIICCAAPYALVTLGLLSVSAGAYFGRALEAFVNRH
jgi:hypothetical protein